MRSYDILDTECENSFDEIAALAAKLIGTSAALVSLIDDDRQWFKDRFGLAAHQTPREHAFCAHAIKGTALFEVSDASRDVRFAAKPLVTGGRKSASTPVCRWSIGIGMATRSARFA